MGEQQPTPLSLAFGRPVFGHCAACNVQDNATAKLAAWQEHDDQDRPTGAFVWLCRRCSDRLIEPHPLLYKPIQRHAPFPGVMPICGDCPSLVEGVCASPLAKRHGGPGIEISGEQPAVAHFDGTRNGRRMGWTEFFWRTPRTGCSGKDAGRSGG